MPIFVYITQLDSDLLVEAQDTMVLYSVHQDKLYMEKQCVAASVLHCICTAQRHVTSHHMTSDRFGLEAN